MSTQFYVHQARAHVERLRQRLYRFGYTWSLEQPLDLESLAAVYLDCIIVRVPGLTDRAALKHLRMNYGMEMPDEEGGDAPLAGGLYATERGLCRWIFVEANDSPQRQRFTIAHEVGHLVLEAEPLLETREQELKALFQRKEEHNLVKFGRCPPTALDNSATPTLIDDTAELTKTAKPEIVIGWTQSALREIRANHFAAELVLPYEGVKHFLKQHVAERGIRTDADMSYLSRLLADRYGTSVASARVRLTKDLGITPLARTGNIDLFE